MIKETALIILGVQNDDNNNVLMMKSVVSKIADTIMNAIEDPYYHIYLVKDGRDKKYNKTLEALWRPQHHIQGTTGFNIVPEIDNVLKFATYEKMDISVKPTFGSIDMIKRMKDRNNATGQLGEVLIIGGDETNILSAAVLIKSNFKDLVVSVKDDSIYYNNADSLETLGLMLNALHVNIK